MFLLHGALYGENPVYLWTYDGGAIGVVSSLEASHLEFRLGQAVVVVGWWCCPRAAAEEVRFIRAAWEVQRTHGCWWSWAGAHGAVVIPVTAVRRLMLSEWFQISESLAEKCEAVDEARPPRRVARINVFYWHRDGSVLLKHH